MATFSDIATLMLCFFVLLLSFANMDVQNFRTALGSVKEAFGVQFKIRGSHEALSSSPVELSDVQMLPPSIHELAATEDEVVSIVEAFIQRRGLAEALEVSSDPRGVVVRAKDHVLFDSGQARLKDGAVPVLDAMTELFHAFNGRLAIEGHTDNRPINTSQFPSNWELSAARASAVLRFMSQGGLDPALVYIAGYAHMRPVVPNTTDEARARNRRVEFVFEYLRANDRDTEEAFDVDRLRRAALGPGSDETRAVTAVDAGAETQPSPTTD